MLKKNDNKHDILTRIGGRDGMTVPEGYFADFESRMSQMLPDNGFARSDDDAQRAVVLPRSRWQRLRPYAYMAAMFAGVWCMMKMFSMISSTNTDLSIENNPVLLEALSDDHFVNEYIYYEEDDYELLEDMYNNGVSVDELTEGLDTMMYDDVDTYSPAE